MVENIPEPLVTTAPVADPWWRGSVVYENHLPSFRDGTGDGVGDLLGLIQALDYLAGTLGITAVWVGPFFPSPMLDQGFDVTDYCNVNPLFGDLGTFDRLVTEAHARGIAVIVDYIPNHTSDQHPWFVESRSSLHNPRRGWYIWASGKPGGLPPNNWTSEAGGSVWEPDDRTGQLYLHSHLREQPDLNWRNPDLRAAMLDVLRFWLDRGADGFRIDVAHMLMKDPELRDNPPSPDGAANPWDLQHPDFDTQLHVNDRTHPDLHGVLREMRSLVDAYPGDRVLIGEIGAMDWPDWAQFYGSDLDGLQLPFAFRLIETSWNGVALADALAGLDGALPAGTWPILALGNHDRPRLASRLGKPQARVAAMLLLTLRGTPSLFYGDELGLRDQPVPRERQRDYFGLREGGVSRDPSRTPMPWDSSPHGGFSTADEADLWLPASVDFHHDNVARQLAAPDSMLNLYRSLISLRRSSEALRAGDWTLETADASTLAYRRRSADDHKVIALNLTDREQVVAEREAGIVVLSTLPGRSPAEFAAGPLRLAAHEGVVIDVRSGTSDGST